MPRKSTKAIKSDRLLDHISTAVMVAGGDLKVLQCNAAAENLLEISAVKMLGMRLPDLFGANHEFENLVNVVARENRAYTDRDLKLVTPALKQLVVDCTISPLAADTPEDMTAKVPAQAEGEPCVVIELTSVERHQRIQLEETMLMQNHATAALMRGLAHEVKNPLGGIRGAAQLLERELDKPHHSEYTQIIIGEADRLRGLVDRMLGPRGQRIKQATNIHEVLEHVRSVVVAEQSDNIELERDYDPSLPELMLNRDELVQAFLNLIRNAMQALSGEGGKIKLKTRARRSVTIANKFHRLVLSTQIIDDGPGVDQDIAESIFFPMVSGRAEGSGLGLPLSQAIVNRYGGLIGFTSEPGNTVFTVWLPVEVKNESS